MASTKLKVSLGLLSGYCNCCNFMWGLIECVLETLLVIVCIPFVPFLCMCAACEKEQPEEPEELDRLVNNGVSRVDRFS